MRLLVPALVCVVLAAGCATPAPQDGPATPAPGQPLSSSSSSPLADAAGPSDPTFCQSASGCTFWDDDYHEYVLYDVADNVVDVLIVPAASIDSARDTQTARAAVQAWDAGVNQLGATWFASNYTIRTYVLGSDNVPPEVLADPEIVVVLNEHDPFVLFGIGLEPKQFTCQSIGLQTTRQYASHVHDGATIAATDCTGIGFICFAINTGFLLEDTIWMYDLVAHEVGHCLGPGHVGDALDFSAKRVPIHDIMSYQHDATHVHCVSNMNVRVLEGLYAPIMGQTSVTPLHAGDYYTMPMSQYSQVSCANP